MSDKRSVLRKRFALLIVSTLFALAAAEGVARIVFGTPLPERLPILEIQSNESRGWMMVPGKMHYTYHYPVNVNSLGLRGPEPQEKSAGTKRVLVLGDSLTYGQGVGDEQTVPWYLQSALNERDTSGREWEVVNGGHRAYDTHQELALLEELGPRIQSDVVVVCWFWNDVLERNIARTYERLKEVEPIAFDFRTRYEGWTRVKWFFKQLGRRSTLLMVTWDAVASKEHFDENDSRMVDAIPRLGSYLDRFVALSNEWGFELVFSIVPEPRALEYPSGILDLEAAAGAAAAERGIAVVRLKESLEKLDEIPLVPFDGHYAAPANRAMGEQLADWLLR
jgi:hypothetical protein